ncbi:MAG TPA: arabinofuranosidase catalytic domain-containing protein, partial [Kofleriaceae bacterium]|nr:arabinofuranosidase catalytic domain-containing protein [Kofleriaceae bacterium]
MSTVEIPQRIPRLAARLLIGAVVVIGTVGVASAQTLPCDIYGSAGTACVAAHSTTRALFGAYSGRLYQVKRASDGATTDVGTLATGGYANAAAQDAFCAGTTCTITIIYDQSSRANHLLISPAGGAGGADVGANAAALPAVAGGHKVYGVHVVPGTGYRDLSATGTARNGQAEGMY